MEPFTPLTVLASDSAEQAQGVAVFGVSWQALLIQAISFLLIVLILKKWVIGKLYHIIDARQQEIDKGLDYTESAKKELEKAQDKVDAILAEARENAETLVAGAKEEATAVIKQAEDKAAERAEKIIADARNKLDSDIKKARAELKQETAQLISEVAATVINQKLSSPSDMALITKELENRRG